MTTRQALAFVRRHGVVLMAARGRVPSLAEAIAGGPYRGSWWGHPKGKEMFRLFGTVSGSRDVLVCRLAGGKITFVHRRLWPALVRLASRFPKSTLAAVREEHTASGAHRAVSTPFPKWVPRPILAAGRRLDPDTAAAALRPVLPRMLLLAFVAAGVALGCGRGGTTSLQAAVPAPKTAAAPMKAPSFPYVVTYAGDIPCADCAHIHMTLTLFPDGTYRLRREYRGAAAGRDAFVDLGRRLAGSDSSLLVLQGSEPQPLRLKALAPDRLRLLDKEGHEVASSFNNDLTLQPSVDRISGPLRLSGLYSTSGDAPVFEECVTGKTFPVLPVGAGRALEGAYLSAKHAPGKPLLVRLEGQLVERAPEPGQPVREHLIVDRPNAVGPGTTCPGR